MPGASLWIVYQSDNQINVYYSYLNVGTHWLSVSAIHGTSNQVPFTVLAGNPTPYITWIDPSTWQAGTTTVFTITGTNGSMDWDNTLLPDEPVTFYAWHTDAGEAGMDPGTEAMPIVSRAVFSAAARER